MTTHQTLDVDFARSCFPAFAQPLPARTAFFENAGGSYVAASVIEKLCHFYRANKVQPYGESSLGQAAGEQMDAGRQAIVELLGVESEALTLGPSTTQNINTLALACTPLLDPNSEIIVTEQDHEANIGAWQRLCARNGAKLVLWPVNRATAELEIEDFEALLNPAVRLVCMTHSSNIVGSINPVEQVVEQAHAAGAFVVLDGVSYAPHRWPDIPQLKADVYCFSSYKTYATHLGVMVSKPEFVARLEPQCHYFNRDKPHMLLDAAGPDHASIAALAGLAEYFELLYNHHFGADDSSLYKKASSMASLMYAHEVAICQPLIEAIKRFGFTIIGHEQMPGREANLALLSQRHSSRTLAKELAKQDIATRNGNFYARRLLQIIGLKDVDDGVLRISLAHYNSAAEIEKLIQALAKLA